MNIDHNVFVEWDDDNLEEDAKWIMFGVLCPAYPGHPWWVRAYKGGFYIGRLDFPDHWVMNVPTYTKIYSASDYKKRIVMNAGEFLERGNMLRGRLREGDEMTKVEGVPEKKTAEIPNIVIGEPDKRETLMPQVKEIVPGLS